MKIITKEVRDLTRTEYLACYLANYRESGYMQDTLSRARKFPMTDPCTVIMLWDGPEDKVSSLIGWASLSPTSLKGMLGVTRYVKSKSKYTAQFWVKQQYRRKGHAKTLMNEVKKYDPNPHVFPHCHASGEFFSSYKVTSMQDGHHYLKRKKPKVA